MTMVEHTTITAASSDVPRDVLESVRRTHAPVLIGHVVPDADALGSMLALAVGMASDPCRPKISLPAGSLSQRLKFLFDMAGPIVASEEDFAKADGFIVLDTAKKARCNVGPALKDRDWSAARPMINIDHHATNTRFGDVNWVVADAGSTCELAYYLLRRMEVVITPTIATLLYAGILSDTLGFSLPSTSASALQAASEVVRFGALVGELGERLYRSQTRGEFELLRVVYDNTKIAADGRIAYSYVSFEEIHGAGCTAADIDEQINVPRSLCGVQLAMLFSEGNRGKTRINFRGSGPVTIAELASEFKGGGHRQSAGAILDCGLQEAMDRVLPKALEHIRRFPRE